MLRGKAPQSGREGPRRRKVILLGFMGSGKSKVGRLVATHRGAAFVDTDEIIAEYAGKSIPDIFEQDGEEAFRGLETEAIRTALDGPAEVIALGGGAATRDENWRLIEDAGALTIYLKASPEVILARVGKRTGPPTARRARRTRAAAEDRRHARRQGAALSARGAGDRKRQYTLEARHGCHGRRTRQRAGRAYRQCRMNAPPLFAEHVGLWHRALTELWHRRHPIVAVTILLWVPWRINLPIIDQWTEFAGRFGFPLELVRRCAVRTVLRRGGADNPLRLRGQFGATHYRKASGCIPGCCSSTPRLPSSASPRPF